MKKRTIKFVGWALALTMMVGSIGVASLASTYGNQNAIAAHAEDGYTKVARYDFASTATSSTDPYANVDSVLERFANSASKEAGLSDIVTSVQAFSRVYPGFGNYGSFGLKLGTSSSQGSIRLSTSVGVTRAVIVAAGWGTSDSFSVGGADSQTPGVAYTSQDSLKTLTFDFAESSDITVLCTNRGFIQSIEFYAGTPSSFSVTYDGNGALSGSVVDETEYEAEQTVTVKPNGFTNEAYLEFTGWNTRADGQGVAYQPGATFNIAVNTTLYAQWALKDVELPDGSYTATFPYANPIPTYAVVKSGDVAKGAIAVASTGVACLANYSEYELAKSTGAFEFTNRTNAKFTKIVISTYQFDNYDVYADGEKVHTGDDKGGHTDIEIELEAESTIRIQNHSSKYTAKMFSVEFFMRVGNEEVHPTGVELNATSGDIFIGKSRQLTASVLPLDADDRTVTWSTSDPDIATVDENGLVSGVAAGNVTITATTNDGGLEATFTGTVKDISYGTLGNPLMVEQAYDVLESENPTSQAMYVKGRVNSSSFDQSSVTYTLWLESSDGTVDHYFELYCVDLSSKFNSDAFTGKNAFAGMTVVATGCAKIYNNIREVAKIDNVKPRIESIEMSAEQFANYMMNETNRACESYSGENDSSDHVGYLSSIWNDLATIYGYMTEEEKEILINATANQSGTIIEQAVARYDYIAAKYHFNAFIVGRSPISLAQYVYSPVFGGNAAWAIALVATVSVGALAVGAFVTLRKKKQD